MQVKLSSIHVNGLKIRYAEAGKGKPVFMLHGWGGDLHSFEALSSFLDIKKYHLFAVDMPGFGKSDAPKHPWSVKDYSIFLEEFVQKIYTQHGLKGMFNVIVHSFGGRVIIKSFDGLVGTHLKELDQLVLIAAAGIKHPLSVKKKVLSEIAKVVSLIFLLPGISFFKDGARKILYKILRAHDYERTSGVMRKTFINVIGEDLTMGLEQINCPTLIVWGTDDKYVPVADAYLMNQKIVGSRLKIVEGGRHGIHKTHAKLLGKWINEFFG